MTDITLSDPALQANPYPAYRQLRENAPVYRAPGPGGSEIWLITRYEEARAALIDPRLAKSHGYAPQWVHDFGVTNSDGDGPLGRNLLSVDPPDHTRLRRLVTKAFTRRRIEALRPRVQEVTDALLDQIEPGTEVDLLAALATPLPITMICELLGVPEAERTDFREWTLRIFANGGDAASNADSVRAREEMAEYVIGLVAQARKNVDRTANPDDLPDLISAMVVATDEQDRMSESELVGMIQLLLVAGHETTVNLIGNGMLALLTHPDQLKLLLDDPGLVPNAVEELLRYDGPVERATPRYTTEDVEIGGVTIPARSVVSIVLASADHDLGAGDDLDITRADHSHIAFGHGIHFCLGAPLARLEGQVAIGTLLRRFPDVALAGPAGELHWRANGVASIIRGLLALPLQF